MCEGAGHGVKSREENGGAHRKEGREESREILRLHQNVLEKNNQAAEKNRVLFRDLLAINLMSAPGAGKTTLIQQLLTHTHFRCGVVVGDLATDHDAKKIRQTGTPAIQITTGNLCYLDAENIAKAARKLDLAALDFMIIENVGNLVCPAMYDLGEDLRIVLMSVTEGEDKPLKYPALFKSANAVVISKTDLATAVEFDRKKAMAYLAQVVPQTPVFEISARSTKGIDAFHTYLAQALKAKRPSFSLSV